MTHRPMPDASPIPFHLAPRVILERLAALAAADRPRVVAIAGPVGAGKSTLASLLSTCIVPTDAYLPDYDLVAPSERDLPHHADFPRLLGDLGSLLSRRETRIPVWSFQTHKRVGDTPRAPADVIVIEGIHALHEPVLPLLDVRVFVDAPRDVRWSRWEHIERTGQRGMGVEPAREFFHGVAEPTFSRFESLYRARADLIVSNDQFTHGAPA